MRVSNQNCISFLWRDNKKSVQSHNKRHLRRGVNGFTPNYRACGLYSTMKKILTQQFFMRPATEVARALLGKYLVRRKSGRVEAFQIIETESYDGHDDTTSHAARGKTSGNAPMFGEAGRFYVYLCYGMYWMLNVVAGDEGYPAAVLIRGIKGEKREKGCDGPGRVTRDLAIDKTFNNKKAARKTGLWFEDRGFIVPPRLIKKTPRIGVGGTEEWKQKLYRFFIEI